MKTHEIGIGSFASVMINGKEKYWDSRERGAGARSLFWCVWLNVHDHVHLMKKASKEARKKGNKKERPDCILSLFKGGLKHHLWLEVARVHESGISHDGCKPENSCSRRNRLRKEKPARKSAGTFYSSLFSWSLMELSSGADVPQLHPFDRALLHVFPLSPFTVREPDSSRRSAYQASGWWDSFTSLSA